MKQIQRPVIASLLSAALLGVLAGCASSAKGPSHAGSPAPPPPAFVQNGVGVLQSDYVFYPAYQVYHSRNHGHFVYLEGRSWVVRPTPPGVSTEVLFASPAVKLGTGEAPTFNN
jgi:hypothetical protein